MEFKTASEVSVQEKWILSRNHCLMIVLAESGDRHYEKQLDRYADIVNGMQFVHE